MMRTAACCLLALACTRARPHDPSQVTIHVENDQFVVDVGGKTVCHRSPCDVVLPRGVPATIDLSKSGAAGTITLTPTQDQSINVPIQPAGLPPLPPPPPPPTPPPAGVTFHLKGAATSDVYFDVTYHPPTRIDGVSEPYFCQPVCGASCVCRRCGSPMRQVAKLPAGGTYETSWNGTTAESGECSKGCGCSTPKPMPPGSYHVAVTGYTKLTNPSAVDDNSPTCTGDATFTLPAAAPVEIAIHCPRSPCDRLDRVIKSPRWARARRSPDASKSVKDNGIA
jgi:hypothetical protein